MGSVFHFTAAFTPAPAGIEGAAGPGSLRGLSALIVDDNATNRRMLEELLGRWGMHAEVASGGRQALDLLGETTAALRVPNLILMDAEMPDMDGFETAQRISCQPALTGIPIILLTSIGNSRGAGVSEASGIQAHIQKPLRQSELLGAIRQLIEAAPPEPSGGSRGAQPTRPARRALRILLAEDNPVNRTLAGRLLKKHNHSVTVAHNGREALALLDSEPFDAVLMDLQMPEMDGFAATASIRERERGGRPRIPIVAMTAHAMKSDRERCLAAGMDAYLSKPFKPEELLDTLDRLARAIQNSNLAPT